ncbi:MAG: hypothetical protein JO022_09055, partial [Acidobacteriaceae bacterium]|nr:hypothetical protein [Acidobacteriaceae bacterium]
KGEVFRDLVRMVLSDRDANRTITAVRDDAVEVSDKDGNTATLSFGSNGLPNKLTYEGEAASGPATLEDAYSDWREAGPVKLPYKVTITQAGKKYAEATIANYQVNPGVTVEELSKKP